MRRLHPRHVTQTVTVRSYTEDPTTWVGAFGDPIDVAAQVQETRQLLTDAGTLNAVTVATIRIPPRPDGTTGLDDLEPGAEVTYDGHTTWALAVRRVTRHGMLVYLELTTGPQPPRAGGGFEVVAVLHRTGGFDRDGDPIPAQDVPVPRASFSPGETGEATSDRDQAAQSTGDLFVPSGTAVDSTDGVTITQGPTPYLGRWQVDGDPHEEAGRLVVPLRRP